MKTIPLYLHDPYLKSTYAKIIDIIPDTDGVLRVILDQTVFYPMGGGQPTDQGKFILKDGTTLEVYQVLLKEGEINHYVKTSLPLVVDTSLECVIDWERRYKNMKVHTAGHIVDFSVFLLGYSPNLLVPCKGDHGKKPFIVYTGRVENDFKEALQKQVEDLVARNLKFTWSFENLEEIEKEVLYLQPGLPKNKPLRALRLENVGTVADGGTIASTTSEVGSVCIVEIREKDNETHIYYQCSLN